jgi:hypothetical protein
MIYERNYSTPAANPSSRATSMEATARLRDASSGSSGRLQGLSRYQTSISRSLHKNLAERRRFQDRKPDPPQPPTPPASPENDKSKPIPIPDTPPLACDVSQPPPGPSTDAWRLCLAVCAPNSISNLLSGAMSSASSFAFRVSLATRESAPRGTGLQPVRQLALMVSTRHFRVKL